MAKGKPKKKTPKEASLSSEAILKSWRISQQEATDELQAAQGRDPLRDRYGFLLIDTGAGDSNPTYYWCRSVPALAELACKCVPLLWDEEHDSDGESDDDAARAKGVEKAILKAYENAQRIAERYGRRGADLARLRDDLNQCDLGSSEIEWAGTFSELCECPAGSEARASFWEARSEDDDSEGTDSDRTIPRSLRGEFGEHLGQLS
jgi:hypothetical protein